MAAGALDSLRYLDMHRARRGLELTRMQSAAEVRAAEAALEMLIGRPLSKGLPKEFNPFVNPKRDTPEKTETETKK